MKTKLIALLIIYLFVSNVKAQLPIDEKTGKVIFTDVVQLEGMTKDEIYKKAKMWVVSTLKSGDNMVELDGTNSDQIVATGNLVLNIAPEMLGTKLYFHINEGFLNFKFLVFCKDGRMKYKVMNFNLAYTKSTPSEPEINTSLENLDCCGYSKGRQNKFEDYSKTAVVSNINALIDDFIKNMRAKDEEEEW